MDITSETAGPVNGKLHARSIVISDGTTTAAVVALDVVAIGEIGHIKNDFLPKVRGEIQKSLGIPPTNVIINASHCHGVPAKDTDARTIKVIQQAHANMVPVQVGVGSGFENRIQENRRLIMKDGREIDVRHAYSLPPDEEVASVGPIDPEIGILRLDDLDGKPVAVIYNFACHPIQGVPGGLNTADITGFSSDVIEDNLGQGTVALFLQGCGGDINPAWYKDVDHPRDAEPLGNQLALSTLKGIRQIETEPISDLDVVNETLALPRADYADAISRLESEQTKLLNSLGGTSLNLKTFLPLAVKYNLSEEFPSYYSHRYLQEEKIGQPDLKALDAENRRNMERYIRNIITMEQLTRVNTNLRLLKKHQAQNIAAGSRTLDVELVGLRLGDFRLLTFPGELTVQIGLNLKEKSPHEKTFIAGYTNGYIYYAPTTKQLENIGGAQEDSDCLLAPHWQAIFEDKAIEMLKGL
ncbi:MAG: hypothetical protein HUJ26_10220 [Planctomycetaceae bacterium]|nr:hypothetical protein [Planctomycetaceae bacterium]